MSDAENTKALTEQLAREHERWVAQHETLSRIADSLDLEETDQPMDVLGAVQALRARAEAAERAGRLTLCERHFGLALSACRGDTDAPMPPCGPCAAERAEAAEKELARLQNAVHPWYGPCDRMGTDEDCAECEALRSTPWPPYAECARLTKDLARERTLKESALAALAAAVDAGWSLIKHHYPAHAEDCPTQRIALDECTCGRVRRFERWRAATSSLPASEEAALIRAALEVARNGSATDDPDEIAMQNAAAALVATGRWR